MVVLIVGRTRASILDDDFFDFFTDVIVDGKKTCII